MSSETPPASAPPPIQFPRRPDLFGWAQIADRLGVSEDTAKRYEIDLLVDALPVVYDRFGKVRAFSSAIDAWMDREMIPGPVYRELRALRAAARVSVRVKRRKTARMKG